MLANLGHYKIQFDIFSWDEHYYYYYYYYYYLPNIVVRFIVFRDWKHNKRHLKKLLNLALHTLGVCSGFNCHIYLRNLLHQHICYLIIFSRNEHQFILVSALWAFVQDFRQFAIEQHHLFAQQLCLLVTHFFVCITVCLLETYWLRDFHCLLLVFFGHRGWAVVLAHSLKIKHYCKPPFLVLSSFAIKISRMFSCNGERKRELNLIS